MAALLILEFVVCGTFAVEEFFLIKPVFTIGVVKQENPSVVCVPGLW
jgi:hypothetical protein